MPFVFEYLGKDGLRMKTNHWLVSILFFLIIGYSFGATDIHLNPKLDYNSDSNDGPILTGKLMEDGKVATDKPTYVMVYSNLCFNSKRQARRTEDLYKKYQDKVKFILIDLDAKHSDEQKSLMKKHPLYFQIPWEPRR